MSAGIVRLCNVLWPSDSGWGDVSLSEYCLVLVPAVAPSGFCSPYHGLWKQLCPLLWEQGLWRAMPLEKIGLFVCLLFWFLNFVLTPSLKVSKHHTEARNPRAFWNYSHLPYVRERRLQEAIWVTQWSYRSPWWGQKSAVTFGTPQVSVVILVAFLSHYSCNFCL